jgi:hypothetical protein
MLAWSVFGLVRSARGAIVLAFLASMALFQCGREEFDLLQDAPPATGGDGSGGLNGSGGRASQASGGMSGGRDDPGLPRGTDCNDDDDCVGKPGHLCWNGYCVECTPTDSCKPGEQCEFGGRCRKICADESDCTEGLVCKPRRNVCVECANDADCKRLYLEPRWCETTFDYCALTPCGGQQGCPMGSSCLGGVCR